MRKRRKLKRERTLPDRITLRHKWTTAVRACAVTWVTLLTCFGITIVGYQANLSGYAVSEKLFSVRRSDALSMELSAFGNMYRIDLSPLNTAAGALHPYAVLIPAPLRLPRQLYLYGEERYREQLQERKKREFIENI